jgi:hypothetical protein
MSTDSISPLRQRMIEDMNARKLCAGTQKGHIRSWRRFAAFLKRSPDTPTVAVPGFSRTKGCDENVRAYALCASHYPLILLSSAQIQIATAEFFHRRGGL